MEQKLLVQTSLWDALSSLGKSIETPKGIFYWSSRAKAEAQIDGTIGIAQDDDGTISHLKIAEEWAGTRVMERAPKGKVFAYGPIEGIVTLRQKWLNKMIERHPTLKENVLMPVVTNGITHSLALGSRLLLAAGDTIITADKSWENYEHIYTDVQGIKIETFPLFAGETLNIEGILSVCDKVAQSQKKVVLLLNFPHNQTGFMPTSAESVALGKRLTEFCKKYPDVPFTLLLDDAYEGYVYDQGSDGSEGGQKFSMASELFVKSPNFSLIKLDGISKVMLAYGYRVAFITVFVNSAAGAKALVREESSGFSTDELKELSAAFGSKVGGFIRGEISQVSHHGQILADALMDSWDDVSRERGQVIAMLKDRWQTMMHELSAGFEKYGREKIIPDPCNGGFFCYMNLGKGINPKTIADRLLKEKKIGVVPSAQGLRLAFAGVPKAKIPEMVKGIFEVVYS